jgi:hypothetical protein
MNNRYRIITLDNNLILLTFNVCRYPVVYLTHLANLP